MSDFISTYLRYTEHQESPAMFHSWVAVSIISATLRRRCWLERSFTSLKLYPNTYVVIVGPPGRQKKSTSVRIGVDILLDAQLDVQIYRERMTPEGILTCMNRNKVNFQAQSVTIDSSMFIVAPELVTMFGADQMQAARMVSYLTSWYDCPDIFPYITASHGALEYHNVYPTFLAATAEDLLNVIPQDAQGGLISRIVFVYSRVRKRIPEPKASGDHDLLVDQLRHIDKMSGVFTLTAAARKYYNDWYMTVPDEVDRRVASFMERLPDHVLKLSMILGASRDTMTIDVNILEGAIQVMADAVPGIKEAVAHVSASDFSQLVMRIMGQLRDYGPLGKQQVYTANNFTASVEEIDMALKDLVERRLITETWVGTVPAYAVI